MRNLQNTVALLVAQADLNNAVTIVALPEGYRFIAPSFEDFDDEVTQEYLVATSDDFTEADLAWFRTPLGGK